LTKSFSCATSILPPRTGPWGAQIKGRLLLSDAEERTLADIGYRIGRKALEDGANAAKPERFSAGTESWSPVSLMVQRHAAALVSRALSADSRSWLCGWLESRWTTFFSQRSGGRVEHIFRVIKRQAG